VAGEVVSNIIPTCLPTGTDAKHFARLGINCYGFVPMQLPASFDFPAMFHGADERDPCQRCLSANVCWNASSPRPEPASIPAKVAESGDVYLLPRRSTLMSPSPKTRR
jgi:hypothetical protein